MTKGTKISYSTEELAFIQTNAVMVRSKLTAMFNAQFHRDISEQNIKALCQRRGWKTGRTGCFEKGDPTWNKGLKGYMGANRTSFKKGRVPQNHKPVGYERTTVDGYIEIKTAEPNIFELKHRLIYEQHFGPIPAGHAIKFKDGNSQNLDIENMVLMSRGELAVLNKCYSFNSAHTEAKPVLITLAKVKTKIGAVKRKPKHFAAQLGGE